MIKVDANLFRIAYACVSTEETLYYLNGVHIEAHPTGGALLVSTDGHLAIVIHDPDGICDGPTAIVRMDKPDLGKCKGIGASLTIDKDAGTATLKDIDERTVAVMHDAIIDGVFPDWWRVVPKAAEKPAKSKPTSFSPKFLGDWAKLGQDISKTLGVSYETQIALSDGASPVVIRFAAKNIFGVLMPMRSSIEGHLPEFMEAVTAARTLPVAAE